MLHWIGNNLGTILITLALLAVVAAILRSLHKSRRAGKSSCGCSCAHCAMAGSCHGTQGAKK